MMNEQSEYFLRTQLEDFFWNFQSGLKIDEASSIMYSKDSSQYIYGRLN
jgi:hypothetical protein